MAEKKMTKKEQFNRLANIVTQSEVANKQEILNFIQHEIELLEKKSSGKPTKTQLENKQIKEEILIALNKLGKMSRIADLMTEPNLQGLSNQKISALISQLVKEQKVERTEIKKQAFFKAI